jgi:hypothetical protein
MNCDVVHVQSVSHLHLIVTFRDGLKGEVIFRESHLNGVFEPLKNPVVFFQVRCEHGFVEWPGEIDLAPDVMYEEVKKNGAWELV